MLQVERQGSWLSRRGLVPLQKSHCPLISAAQINAANWVFLHVCLVDLLLSDDKTISSKLSLSLDFFSEAFMLTYFCDFRVIAVNRKTFKGLYHVFSIL